MVFLNVPMMQQPEAYIGGADKLFDDAGNVVVEGSKKFFESIMKAFAAWVEANVPRQ